MKAPLQVARKTSPLRSGPARAEHDGAPKLGNRALGRLLASPSLEAQADKAADAMPLQASSARAPSSAAHGSAGKPLDAATRAHFERGFGQDFSGVRVHDDAAAQGHLKSAQALAFTHGSDIAFAAGSYRPETPQGQRLIAHELAHVVQQRGGSVGAAGAPALSGTARGVQAKSDRDALLERLAAVRARLAELRAQQTARSDSFADSMMKERLGESLQRGRRDLKAQARTDMAANRLWGGPLAAKRINSAVTVSQTGNAVTVSANLQVRYQALSDAQGRNRAAADIPRIDAAIRNAWQVNIASGDYAGIAFRLLPTVSYLPPKGTRAANAFLIDVRAPDTGPSSGDSVSGLISLAPVHLEPSRVIVVAHELAHLFGFTDAYIQMITKGKRGEKVETWSVGRRDEPGADLLGLIDPVVLKRLQDKGAVLPQDVARQTGPVRIWEGEASQVLRTLGVAPPVPARPTPDSEDFDPTVELDRVRQQGEAKLAKIQVRGQRAQNSLDWLDAAEEAIRLEDEERDLNARLASTPASSSGTPVRP